MPAVRILFHFFVLFFTCNALKINLVEDSPCALTFAAHSGFGNQVMGLQGAAFVSKLAGCKLELPPVLEHFDVAYGKSESCSTFGKERSMAKLAASHYDRRKLQWDQLFTFSQDGVMGGRISHPFDFGKTHFLEHNCTLWDRFNAVQDTRLLKQFLKDQIANTEPSGKYIMGSGFNSGTPRVDLSEIITGYAPDVVRGIGFLKGKLQSSKYGCIHLRSGDSTLQGGQGKGWDKGLEQWVTEQSHGGLLDPTHLYNLHSKSPTLANVTNVPGDTRADLQLHADDSLWRILKYLPSLMQGAEKENFASTAGREPEFPLFIMSGMPEKLVNDIMGPVCAGEHKSWSTCVSLKDLAPQGLGQAGINLNFPKEQKDYEQLILEMGMCSQANVAFLPSIGKVWIDNHATEVDQAGADSTLSKIVQAMNAFQLSAD